MKTSGLLLAAAFAPMLAGAQNPVIQGILDEVRIDSMMLWVNEVSGEVPVMIDGQEHTLLSRHKNNEGNNLAQAWLMQLSLIHISEPTRPY